MRRSRQQGFSLIEVLTATTAAMLIALPALALLFQVFEWSGEVNSRIALNRQAREVMYVLANGAKMTTAGTDATTNVYGMRARKTAPAVALRNAYRLQYPSNGLTLTGAEMAALTVPCSGPARPLPDCTATESKTVQGWVGSDPVLNSATRSVAGRTTEIAITLTDPFEAQKQENPAYATERYRAILTRNRDNNDP